VRRQCGVPLIASGGAGAPAHFAEVFRSANVDGALAASVFHSGSLPIPTLKRFLREASIEIRP
jgi:cyclase